ncbi:MAG: hypothetical protein ACR5K2_04295 [Wolbachia sp.]
MPQLDVSTFFSQVFWFLFFFSLLFFVVNCLFLPKLDEIISIRSNKALNSFNSSIHLLKLIENQTVKYNAALNEARTQAKKVVDNALIQAEEMEASMKDILEEEDKKMSKLVNEEVARFKSEYTNELMRIATGITLIYYSKLTNSKIEEEFVASLISKEF